MNGMKNDVKSLSPASKTRSGMSVIEIIIAAAIILAVTAGAAAAWTTYIRMTNSSSQKIIAALLLDEGSEAVQLFRDSTWKNLSSLSLSTPYYLYWTGTKYATSTSKVLIQTNYIRTITLKSVMRDANFNIIASGGTTDANTYDVTVAVSLATSSTPIATSEMLIHNVYNN
jgi:Tfp pilus assembly protein PilV